MNIDVRMATSQDRLAIEDLHDYVHFTMKESGLKQEFFMPYIENNVWRFETGNCVLASDGTDLVGVTGAIMHGKELYRYASMLDIHPNNLAELFIFQHPDYRALSEYTQLTEKRISEELTNKIEKYLRKNRIRFACATSHPEHPAKEQLVRLGFTQVGEPFMARDKYERVLLKKDVGFDTRHLKRPKKENDLIR